MKISKLFHWLYAAVMFLPLVALPCFALAVRSDNNFQPISVQVNENKVIDFNQKLSVPAYTKTYTYDFTGVDVVGTVNVRDLYVLDHVYIIKFDRLVDTSLVVGSSVYTGGSDVVCFTGVAYSTYYQGPVTAQPNTILHCEHRYQVTNVNYSDSLLGSSLIYLYGLRGGSVSANTIVTFNNFQLFDLTQMFGVGNEPSLEEFNVLFPNSYYDYNLSEIRILNNYSIITYNDTDVGSQMVYTMYNLTDKYLNFDNVFNLYQINEWINLNVFNGSAPLIWFIVWHILDYWLLLSIFWLCFDVLIYVPQLAHRWLDKAALE